MFEGETFLRKKNVEKKFPPKIKVAQNLLKHSLVLEYLKLDDMSIRPILGVLAILKF